MEPTILYPEGLRVWEILTTTLILSLYTRGWDKS